MTAYPFALAISAVVVLLLLWLLRSRRLKEKYAGIWIVLALAVVVVGVFPDLAGWLARLVGVQTPINLVFLLGFVVVLAVCIQLSAELSRAEETSRTLAEEIALLALRVEHVERSAVSTGDGQDGGTTS
ncbi:DUF2304 domain-containing protein [Cellulomonas biazotea]|jgi:hypothetical protein|uniref:DUF2304 domain-containing protein n=1 Tax=Cellulomonas biazotea TaxID=1709 RepID=A0A402DUA8_9CELL|nr:DUF2304 domain-containing protein [Cellulomonas biazotea]GCE77685.1 hypothetical protein CBZ_27410 [Cellulomonas biazotea]